MSKPLGDPPLKAVPPPPTEDDAVNLLDDSIEPTDDSPTVISKTPQAAAPSKSDDNFSGSLRGRRLAHFELIEPIGVGGMAAVLRARDTQLDRLVALKILPPEMASDAENIRRFHQEARSAAKLDHENIARVFFCGEDQRLHFIAFEFVEGENLRTILERRGRLPVGEALHYMLQVAAGLAHASHRGVVHRDIKPSNIIITPNGRAKLVDMGLARSLEPQHDMGLTQSGVTLGTFDYISPEQALEPRDADVRSDIYSLGCTFYHMLTGHPPVPEGTAAKKLHHHQHVKPPDPRQFVPDLPDEAAVILDRMMAKQPKDRYQTPEQLVHHLYLAARKLGAAGEVPEGVLAVEAALPQPPTGRPLALAVLAAVAVIGLIVFLEQSSSPRPEPAPNAANSDPSEPRERPPSRTEIVEKSPAPGENASPSNVVVPPLAQVPVFNLVHPTAADLADFLQKNKQAREIVLELDDLDLRSRDNGEPSLTISNPKVTLRPRNPQARPTIRYAYDDARTAPTLQAPLTIESKECIVEGIRFVLDQKGAGVPMAALRFRGVRQATVQRCEFIQANPFGDKNRMTSVLVESKTGGALVLSECCFLGFGSLVTANKGNGLLDDMVLSEAATGGQDAVTRRGPVRIEAVNCLFGPHTATLRLEGAAPDNDGLVRLDHCSVLAANQSAVYDLADRADARIEANFSLFSHPGDPGMAGMAEGKGAVLVRRASDQGQVAYKGHENRYHLLDSYLVIPGVPEETVQRLLDQLKKDDDSRELASSPWKDAAPLRSIEQLAARTAFEVNPLLSELRVPLQERAKGQLVGVERALTFCYLDKLPPLKDGTTNPAGRRELIVENRDKEDPDKRLYPTLRHAVNEAQSGDIIRLRLDGEVKLDPLPLNGTRLSDLTIAAAPGFHPILTLSETEEVDAALFRVHYGRLQLEDLEVRLQPGRDGFDSQCVVSFLGDGECVLKNCLVTLDRSGRRAALTVAILSEPGKLMKKSDSPAARSRDQGPSFVLENSFVRGLGDLVWSQGGQPAEVSVKNSLVALSGSLLNVEGNKEMTSPAGSLTLQLRKVTTYLGGNLIRLKAGKDLKSLAQLRCEPENCLFLPMPGDRALVHLEGPESEERGLKGKLTWIPAMNAYGSFNTLLEQQSNGTMMKMPLPATLEAWKNNFSGETDSEYNVKPINPPAPDLLLTLLQPSALRTSDKLKDYGVDLAALRSLAPLRERSEDRTPRTESSIPDAD
jgi:serine/threonine protein kinase